MPENVTPSPMQTICNNWLAARAACDTSPYPDDSPRDQVLFRRLIKVEDAAAEFVPATAEDFALKVIIANEGFDYHQNAIIEMACGIAASPGTHIAQ